ncbi:MAG: hypothetical protein ABIQ08_08575 [Duganella sp.]
MSDKNAKEAGLVAQYKATAALRLAGQKAKNTAQSSQADKAPSAVVTVRFAPNSKPLSAFGGVTKVLGPSRIQIPEYKLHRR